MEVNSLNGLKGPFLAHAADTLVKPDFSGWATKAGLKCTDGVTIMGGAFKHQDQTKVPLVWSHGHTDPTNVLGYAMLSHKDEGVWADCFFNETEKAKHAKGMVAHGDVSYLSIWANDLLKKGSLVMHGAIREVSLVLAGANPGAVIDPVSIRHSDGSVDDAEDQAIITTGETITHEDGGSGSGNSGGTGTQTDDEKISDVIATMDEKQQNVLHYMVEEALKTKADTAQHSNTQGNSDKKGDKEVKHNNVFEQNGTGNGTGTGTAQKGERVFLSHDDMRGIVGSAISRKTTLKQAVEEYALAHGIENIGMLFPEAKLVDPGAPGFISRDMAWVNKVMGNANTTPFARTKSRSADITFEAARAKGYIKGHMKKEEFFAVAQRETTPKTIYKKQKLDRDDMIDITDYDVVAWLKGEMRLMLNEEIARAVLVGDGRDPGDEDKINENNIRPIATDDPFYVVSVNVDLNGADATIEAVHDAILLNRQYYKGSGNPTLFCSSSFLSQSMLVRDNMGRKIYGSKADLVSTLLVEDIVTVEILDDYPDISAILVNMRDYTIGTDRGGEVTLFDDFDIDYNQYKYLIETRMSGALTKPRSAMVVRATGAGAVPATATAPAWDAATYTVTIPVDANVDYVNAQTGDPLADGANVLAPGEVLNVRAVPTAGHYLTNVKVEWSFLRPTSAV